MIYIDILKAFFPSILEFSINYIFCNFSTICNIVIAGASKISMMINPLIYNTSRLKKFICVKK